MRKIDISNMEFVHYGREWDQRSPPCSREMMPLLEKKECFVFWLQPKGGKPSDQVAALKLKDGFYTLSLRMMKAIWRHVRLKKGFKNIERTHTGSFKLKIPAPLMSEKLRTQARFNVSGTILQVFVLVLFRLTLYSCLQAMRTKKGDSRDTQGNGSATTTQTRNAQTAHDVMTFVREHLFSVLDDESTPHADPAPANRDSPLDALAGTTHPTKKPRSALKAPTGAATQGTPQLTPAKQGHPQGKQKKVSFNHSAHKR